VAVIIAGNTRVLRLTPKISVLPLTGRWAKPYAQGTDKQRVVKVVPKETTTLFTK
jgi:hypothetical protein